MSYLDTGLASTYFSDADQLVIPPSGSPNSLSQTTPTAPQRSTRRYKTQLRDFLSTCRSKRKLQQQQQPQQQTPNLGQVSNFIHIKHKIKNWQFTNYSLNLIYLIIFNKTHLGYTTCTSCRIHSRFRSCSGRIFKFKSNVYHIAISII